MDTKSQIRQFIVSNYYVPDPGALSDGASLLESGIIDSTGVIEVISFIEETFKVTVDDAEMIPENLDSIAKIDAYVSRKRA
jgi:acyl carrier protein